MPCHLGTRTWVQENPTCPLCKSDIHEIRYDLSEDGKHGKTFKVPTRHVRPERQAHVSESATGLSLSSESRSIDFGQSEQVLLQDEDEALQRRRFIYRHDLYSLHIGSSERQPSGSRYRELSPQLFRKDPEVLSRAKTWLSRELRVFSFLFTNNHLTQGHDNASRRPKPKKAEFLHAYIIAILQTIDIQDSSCQAEELIRDFLGRRYAQLFLHELKAWLRSPYKWLGAWDRAVQYSNDNTFPRMSLEVVNESDLRLPA